MTEHENVIPDTTSDVLPAAALTSAAETQDPGTPTVPASETARMLIPIAQLAASASEVEVPVVEHDGSWHTLH